CPPTGEKSALFLSSPAMCADAELGEMETLCQATEYLSVVDSKKTHEESAFSIDQHAVLPECPRLDSLPWPPLNRLFHFLRSDEECTDLANFSQDGVEVVCILHRKNLPF
ncbi:hypothetical protein PMAYCL1PPCAC_27909, partial [Pristionchus mayeri]